MTTKPLHESQLPTASTGFYSGSGLWVCTGSQMGRPNILPENTSAPGKLRMIRLGWHDGDYDAGGAYWGNSGGTCIYWAKGDLAGEEFTTQLFVRAKSRAEAKRIVLETLPHVTFYR